MTHVSLVDVSLRDGNQSIWGAVGLTTRMVKGVAPALDEVGYRTVELMSSTQVAVAVRFHQEDPWERIRAARDRMPRTQLGFLTTGKRFITFYRTPDAIFELAFELLVRNGISRLWVIDPMHDMNGARKTAALAKRVGFEEVVGGICYATSPVHTDEYFATKIAELDSCPDIDSIYLKDPAGLLTPERLLTLQPKLQRALKRLKLNEIHSHATTGVSPQTVLMAADLGMEIIHCALPPVANGSSHPSAFRLVENLRARGHSVTVDEAAMRRASDYLVRQGRIKRLAVGSPQEYDEAYYHHTIPGGVQSTLRRQLKEMGREDLFDAVIEESVQVREDLGWPIVMTPFAQYIVTQATLNTISGERYRQISDEIIDLLNGDFGPLPGPVNQDLLDRAIATRKKAKTHEPGVGLESRADLRARFGVNLSDEELLLRAVMPSEQVDAMVAARSNSHGNRIRTILEQASGISSPGSLSVTNGDYSVTVERGVRSGT